MEVPYVVSNFYHFIPWNAVFPLGSNINTIV